MHAACYLARSGAAGRQRLPAFVCMVPSRVIVFERRCVPILVDSWLRWWDVVFLIRRLVLLMDRRRRHADLTAVLAMIKACGPLHCAVRLSRAMCMLESYPVVRREYALSFAPWTSFRIGPVRHHRSSTSTGSISTTAIPLLQYKVQSTTSYSSTSK